MKILIFRTILIYLCVLAAMRLMGKRQLGELQPGELVSTILISNLASISIESMDVPLTASLVPLFLITSIEILSSVLSLKSRRFSAFIQGRPKTVVRDGMIDQKVLAELRLSVSDLLSALRGKDIFDLRQVSCAIVETNGSISVSKTGENEPVTLSDLALTPAAGKAFVPFVLEGKPLVENLSWCGKTEQWLEHQLTQRGTALSEVLAFLGNDTEDCFLIRQEASHMKTGGGR